MDTKTENSEEEQKIQDVIDNFDFQKIHGYMELTNWTWYGEGVPSLKSLKLRAKDLLTRVTYDKYTSLATGGFEASLSDDGVLRLKFQAETSVRG